MNTSDKVSAAALGVSVLALIIAGFSGYETWHHNRLIMEPNLEVDCDFDRTAKKGGLYLVNKGLGPAVVDEFYMFGIARKSNAEEMLIEEAGMKKFSKERYPKCYKHIKLGTLTNASQIEPNGHYALLEINDIDLSDKEEIKEWDDFQQDVHDVQVKIDYKSVEGHVKEMVSP